MSDPLAELVELGRHIGREEHQFAILGEGNVSTRLDNGHFAVKASGSCLKNLRREDLTICDTNTVLSLVEKKTAPDILIEETLLAARVDGGKKPSTESVFHAWLLTLEKVRFVGHCHPVSVNQVLCSPRARDFAERRLFPDEVVCCGPASVFIPYADPGLPLAREIRERTNAFIQAHDLIPRLILLQNHGVIALGSTPDAVLACLMMASKAASIFIGAAALGGPNFMTPQHVERIFVRPDESYRQQQLNIGN
jgi:rhamnose utilization protein RhaD (predicted bifunctional aldolase and dehydrogenase)